MHIRFTCILEKYFEALSFLTVLRTGCLTILALLTICQTVLASTAYQMLQSSTPPTFRAGHTLLPLTRASFPVAYDANRELCERWGYAMEITEDDVRHLDDPTSQPSILTALTKADPQRYPIFTLMPRPLWEDDFLASLPEATWCHDAGGTRLSGIFSPVMPDESYQRAADLAAVTLARLRQACPVALVMNSGEYGMSVYGVNGDQWALDPAVMAAKGSLPWYEFISRRQAHYESIMANTAKAAVPGVGNYLYYYTDGAPDRNRYADYWQWCYDYQYMRPVSTIPNSSIYYAHLNTGLHRQQRYADPGTQRDRPADHLRRSIVLRLADRRVGRRPDLRG